MIGILQQTAAFAKHYLGENTMPKAQNCLKSSATASTAYNISYGNNGSGRAVEQLIATKEMDNAVVRRTCSGTRISDVQLLKKVGTSTCVFHKGPLTDYLFSFH